jgi:F-type H+-transporting ATPase subunit epsilon
MTADAPMQVSLRVPTHLVYQGRARRLQAVGQEGVFGMLPAHTDWVTALQPSVLVLTDDAGAERFFGIDHGLLVKRGRHVEVAVRRAVPGESLQTLSQAVAERFEQEDDEERMARTAMSRLESGILRQFGQLNKPAP